MKKQEAIELIMRGLKTMGGLCPHSFGQTDSLPIPAKKCHRCVAETVVDFLEESPELRWER